MPEADAVSPAATVSVAEDHGLLCDAIRVAGAAVKKRFRDGRTKSWEKGDSTPVCEADLESNEILRDQLMAGNRGGYGWLSEECADSSARLEAPRTWIIDPIDGTRSFLEGRPEFTVCGALLDGRDVVAAAIFNPITDEFFEAIKGGGARCNGAPLSASPRSSLEGCKMLAFSGLFSRPGWPQPWPQLDIGYRNSTSYRMALVARGDVDGAIALVPKADWDVAMGALVAAEAGAIATDHLGQPYHFNQPKPVQRALVCAAPGVYPSIKRRLAHLPGDLGPPSTNPI